VEGSLKDIRSLVSFIPETLQRNPST
jgi:hypothetical protein